MEGERASSKLGAWFRTCYNVFKYPRGSADGEATASLRVQLLGEFRCWRDRELIAPTLWRTAKLRALFALFVTERGQVFSQAQLAEQLWPDSEDGLALVRRRISELRHILEPELKKAFQSWYILRRPMAIVLTLKPTVGWTRKSSLAASTRDARVNS